jgi:membrane protein YdbS with pleckstrin-like domain
MYNWTKTLALSLMKAPTEAPESPQGAHGKIQVFRASPKYLTYRLIGFWLAFVVSWLTVGAMVIAGFASGETGLYVLNIITIPTLALIQFCVYFSIRIDYDMRYYIVTDRSLRLREGAFIVKEMTVSYANIQNIRVVQGPLLRFFGIRHLQVDTAGGGGGEPGKQGANLHRAQMAGIENAHEVRDLIQGHLSRYGVGAGLGDIDDQGPGDGPITGRGPAPRSAIMSTAFREALRELKGATADLRRATTRQASE